MFKLKDKTPSAQQRKRVNKKDLFYYVEELDENIMPDINDFYDTIDNLVEKSMIYNSNLSGDELKLLRLLFRIKRTRNVVRCD